MGKLLSYCQDKITSSEQIKVTGDQSTSFREESECPICLGSKNNVVSARLLSEVSDQYLFPFDTYWSDSEKVIVIQYISNPVIEYKPKINGNTGIDYALIVNVQMLNGPALIVAGAHMWGTQGAVDAITNRNWLKNIRSKFDGTSNFAILLKVKVTDGHPQPMNIVRAISLSSPL